MGLVLLDSNILIDLFNGIGVAEVEIAYHANIAISAITWAEVAVGLTSSQLVEFEEVVSNLPIYILHTDDSIIKESVRLRKMSITRKKAGTGDKLKTPDAIIMATANVTGRTLITRNPGDFRDVKLMRVPYQVTDNVVHNIAARPV
ncbi:PIN domain-containing protein [Pseudoduganella sp. SL102]|uniref:PIN domain-containing protein n=1 Tax=Pseudoduganella sp. SL102 TaxID=2995154 RepID=UPI00248AAB9B|nr:PIN domain-containing protein [Pseudoduganella sp. SL102]WBS02381.1 PIN domain-containing protein [Pseudoduganella sp. SL102]